jgi:hypothetical protein
MPSGMAIDDDHYVLDGDGNRVLIGLDAAETREFERLEKIISFAHPTPHVSSEQWHSPTEKRWLSLYQKHRSAIEPFLGAARTRH